jgi:energy-coupling factor transport system substrate-specific component
LIAAIVSGALAGVANAAVCLPLYYAGADVPVLVIYTISAVVSGIVLAGVLSFVVAKALSSTGALSRFPIGKTA